MPSARRATFLAGVRIEWSAFVGGGVTMDLRNGDSYSPATRNDSLQSLLRVRFFALYYIILSLKKKKSNPEEKPCLW